MGGRAAASLEEYHDANAALLTAIELDPSHVQSLLWHAELFQETYNVADAQAIYEEALAINPHRAALYVGLAHAVRSFAHKEQLAQQAREKMPASVGALNLLAYLHLLDGHYAEAETLLHAALAVNPVSIQSLAHLASVSLLRGDTTAFAALEQRVLAINPLASDFYITASENLALRFRYPESVRMAQKAVGVDPQHAAANATLGTGLLRLGRAEQARQYFDRSYQRDAFNLFVANTLTLLDEQAAFAPLESAHFRLLVPAEERDVLGAAMLREAEACFASLRERYPYQPEEKILIEAYNDADDFAVRVAGVPHIGLLGVSFGDVVALNTPRAQRSREYNWARTLCHEIAHTMAIGVSRYSVPRWLTEGISLYEEQRAHAAWGREMELAFFRAFEQERLHTLAEIDRGFTRPAFSGQVLLSYYHAFQVVTFIVDRYGFDAIVDLLEALGQGLNEEDAILQVLGQSRAALDAAFRRDLEARHTALAPVLDNMPDPFTEETEGLGPFNRDNTFWFRLQEGQDALARHDHGAAERHLQNAMDMYPAYIGPDNPYQALITLYRQQGQQTKLMEVLRRFLLVSEYGAAEARELSALYVAHGDIDQALAYLQRSRWVEPYDVSTLMRIAELSAERGHHAMAVEARRAILALDPVDKADAYYELARSLYENSDIAGAKRAVLQSLEVAPGFRDAQRLLLDCVARMP